MPRTTAVPIPATWTSTGTTSAAIHIGDSAVLGIEMPATFSGNTLAIHAASSSGGTFSAIELDGFTNPITGIAANDRISLDPLVTAGWPWIKLVSGSSEAAGRTVNLMTRPV